MLAELEAFIDAVDLCTPRSTFNNVECIKAVAFQLR